MKKENGISFWLQPFFHLDVPLEDSGHNVIVIKACGYYNQWYHCGDVALTSHKHTFHPFCLATMLKDSNKCKICIQKLHPNWWTSWGIQEKMKI
jgi:hypothetical protein